VCKQKIELFKNVQTKIYQFICYFKSINLMLF